MRTLLTSAVVFSALAIAPVAGLAEGTKNDESTAATSATTKTEEQNTGSGQSEAGQTGQTQGESMTSADGNFIEQQKSQQVLSDSYIGSTVYTGSGNNRESVGDIDQLIFNENGEIEGAVVDVGGFLGLGEKPVGLQWDTLTKEEQQGSVVFTTSLTRADLENAPEFRTQEASRSEGEGMTY